MSRSARRGFWEDVVSGMLDAGLGGCEMSSVGSHVLVIGLVCCLAAGCSRVNDRPATAEKATAEKATAEKATAEKATADKATADKATAEKVTTDKVATDKAATEKPATKKPATDELATDVAATDKVAADKPTADEPTADEPTANETAKAKAPSSAQAVPQPVEISATEPAAQSVELKVEPEGNIGKGSIDLSVYPEVLVQKWAIADRPKAGAPYQQVRKDATFKQEGHVLLHIRARLTIKWTENLEKFYVLAEQVLLTDESGEPVGETVGRYEHYGELSLHTEARSRERTRRISASRPVRGFGDPRPHPNPGPVLVNWLFSIPATTKRCKFSFANASAEFAVPTKTTPGPLGPEKTEFAVLGSGFVDELPPTYDGRPGPTKTPGLKYLAVRVRVKGIPSYLNKEGDFHHWNLGWVGIVSDDGTYNPCLGAKINEKLWATHSFNKKYGHENTTHEVVCLFEVPPQTKSFTILCLLAPAAEGTVGQPELEADRASDE